MSANHAREVDNSRAMRPKRLFLSIGWSTAALLLLIIAMPVMAAERDRQLQLVSTAWSPFTNPPGQPRFALDLVEEALERLGIIADTVIVDEARLTPSLLSGEFDGSAALWRDAERERVLIYSQPYLENRLVLVGRTGQRRLRDRAGRARRQADRPGCRVRLWRAGRDDRRPDLR